VTLQQLVGTRHQQKVCFGWLVGVRARNVLAHLGYLALRAVHRAIGDDALDNVLASLEPELQSAILQERKEQEDREARGHWNPTVAQLTTDVLKLFIEVGAQITADMHL